MDVKKFCKILTVVAIVVFYAGEINAGVLEDKEYQYDNVGNITGVIDRINGSQSFTYDEQNRLRAQAGTIIARTMNTPRQEI